MKSRSPKSTLAISYSGIYPVLLILYRIIKMFLEGKSFPSGYLPQDKQRQHVYDIIQVVTMEQYLDEMLAFDHEIFFRVIARAFMSQPLKYLSTQKEYYEKNSIRGNLCMPLDEIINGIFLKKAQADDKRLPAFYKFIITVQSHQNNESAPRINIDTALVLKACLHAIKTHPTEDSPLIEEDIIINALKSKKLEKKDFEKFASDSDFSDYAKNKMPNLRVFLMEMKKDYLNSYKLNKQHPTLKKKIFEWID